ncbi:sulfotransferase [Acrocarpospora phusangensis]|uniref:Sulfotransferase n=1 Tax=Acrocarpospora phusangensis TaxID=1070424 RepID=A0A919UMK4_9ACTN|nr:sulfotransferase [Acrocarpospora phusangensis]GIH21845.1 sulfotransferase [Acrocarpospora phusangensis]
MGVRVTSEPVVVLHIAGAGRSGSTLFGSLLGQLGDCFDVGELGYLWDRGLRQDGRCGCGSRVRACPVWRTVLQETFGPDGPGEAEVERLARFHRATSRGRDVASLWLRGRLREESPEYREILARLIRAAASVSGRRVVVDSTKPVAYGRLLDDLPGVELRVIHLVRDPRAVAWSWLRRKKGTGADTMRTRPVLTTAAMWNLGNLAAAGSWAADPGRYLLIRYEDLIREPVRWLRAAAGLAGITDAELPPIAGSTVRMSPTHTVAGNVGRHDSGEIELRLDAEWSRALPPAKRLLVECATYPLRNRYGYRSAR